MRGPICARKKCLGFVFIADLQLSLTCSKTAAVLTHVLWIEMFLATRTEIITGIKATASTSLEGPKERTYSKTSICTNPGNEACVCIYYSTHVSNLHAITQALITLRIIRTSISVMYH